MENLVTLYTRPDKRIGSPLDFMGMLDTARALCNSLDHVTHKAVRDTVLLTLVVNPIRNAVHDTLRHSLYEDDALRRQVLGNCSRGWQPRLSDDSEGAADQGVDGVPG